MKATQGNLICGVDEAGRGPIAGPVVAAAVILNPEAPIEGLNDSKKLSEKKRLALSEEIKTNALAWAIAQCDADEIDQLNILQASLVAMERAVHALSPRAEHALIDGNHLPKGLTISAQAIVGGDASEPAIAAASILAKVERDRQMLEWHEQYPQYNFKQHKAYPTKQHLALIQEHGVCRIHRKSFAPVKRQLEQDHGEIKA